MRTDPSSPIPASSAIEVVLRDTEIQCGFEKEKLRTNLLVRKYEAWMAPHMHSATD